MEKEIRELIKKVCERWDFYKSKEVREKEYESNENTKVTTLNGYTAYWDNPNILWLLINIRLEGYEEWGNQVGVTKEGNIVWEYQSHCSCNGFFDSTSSGDELPFNLDSTKKSFNLSELPDEWQKIIKVNLEQILEITS
jgi:hypothetical protein